jgi:serine/threonine-protein kinase RsbW
MTVIVDLGTQQMIEHHSRRFERTLPLDVAALPGARQELRAFLQTCTLGDDLVAAIVLCVQEACMNAVRFSRSQAGVSITVGLDDDRARIVVRDYGTGFKPNEIPEHPPDPLAVSGRGLFIIHAFMDFVEINDSGGTEVRMCKLLR